ncbi:uncharacterized protein LOC132883512 isoform X2 [Neoarius graeffei]|uniref:uncharacterized protein LOC132883512 isoform X2 n=1 Tax=Neoarius graeffei TaxID=443677 RepID=UPI00298C91AC|nr:uncharacterized protein LOC132883512 isoform X2 [Neoarius graeffei]
MLINHFKHSWNLIFCYRTMLIVDHFHISVLTWRFLKGPSSDLEELLRSLRIPSVIRKEGKESLRLSMEWRRARLNNIGRADLPESKTKTACVWSNHFISGAPAKLYDRNNPDWGPTQEMGYVSSKINDEFKRVTTVSLESTFMASLDQCTPKLMTLVQSKGGAAGLKIRQIKDRLLENNTVERRREAAIRCLVVYLGEKEEDLFKMYSDMEELEADLVMQVMKIAIISDGCATIVIEGTKVLEGFDVARSCALLMGIIYALNLSYPKQLKFTFEVFQKLFLELDGQKASSKVMSLKYSIF